MSFLSSFQEVVSYFMAEAGADATLLRDDGTGTYTNGEWIPSNTNISIRVLPFDYLKKTEGTGTEPNTLIRSGDKQVYIQPTSTLQTINPESDRVEMAGIIYKIVTTKNLNPSLSDAIVFEVYLRQ